MFLSRVFRNALPILGGLVVGALVFVNQPGSAQQFQRKPPDAKGYQLTQIKQQNLAAARRAAPTTVARVPATYQYTRPAPEPSLPQIVRFQGPDGEVRTFVLEGSVRTVQPGPVIVRLTSK